MVLQNLSWARGRTLLFQVAALSLAFTVFAADAFTAPDWAFTGFYVVVVVMAAQFCRGLSLWAVSGTCIVLTLIAQVLANLRAHDNVLAATGGFNTFGGILVIVVTTYFIHRGQHVQAALLRAQADLGRITRVTTMGALTASIAHEVNQPIAAVVTNASACLRWLSGESPNLEEARAAASRIVRDGTRAAEIVSRIRRLFTRGGETFQAVDVNHLIRETVDVLANEAARHKVSVRPDLGAVLPVLGDPVQLQQVMVNLIVNGIDAMTGRSEVRELTIKSRLSEGSEVVVSVSDTGAGLPDEYAERLFDAFFTTKQDGTGMGLSISRSIIEAHDGRLWAQENTPCGATFCFALPLDAATDVARSRA